MLKLTGTDKSGLFKILALLCVFTGFILPTYAGDKPDVIPVPAGIKPVNPATDSPERILQAFLNVPYRINGAIDENGNYTLFNRPDALQKTAGLNCSGFVLAASRFLLGKNIPLSQATIDRLGDSGKGSPHGEDWDFGWDLILNIAEGETGHFLLPQGQIMEKSLATGFSPRGYDLHDPATWRELPDRLKPGFFYLVSFNKETNKKGYAMQHYHVALIHVNDAGQIMLYQTTGTSRKVYRRNLSDKQQRAIFLKSFANTRLHKKYILILELPLLNSQESIFASPAEL